MLFNSIEFIFLFLPLVALAYHGLRLCFNNGNLALGFLVIASLFFYGWWDPRYLLVILSSIVLNYGLGRRIIALRNAKPRKARLLLGLGITLNLAALAYFKYTTFILRSLEQASNLPLPIIEVVLPLAISFFTFQQIAFLVDAYRGECDDYDFIHYSLFVTFFPQLIAGPIVHHREMMPQFLSQAPRDRWQDIYIGVSFFTFGLIKKVLIADEIAQWSTPVFAAADQGQALSAMEAWGGACAYSLQLYFDFSGYADMAIGAARLFGIHLPLNFASPYKARSIIEFWRRWHMTLSRFLRDYLYIPLGGNRDGEWARYRNLMITMLLGGLWHGAGWNFVIWGALHGFYLVINHVFRRLTPRGLFRPFLGGTFLKHFSAWLLTSLALIIAWVFFRAETFSGATNILSAMMNGFGQTTSTNVWADSADSGWQRIIIFYALASLAPNTQQLLAYSFGGEQTSTTRLPWRPGWISAALCSLLFIIAVFNLSEISEFLYFQF